MEETRAYGGFCWNPSRSGPVTDPARREKGSIDPLSVGCGIRRRNRIKNDTARSAACARTGLSRPPHHCRLQRLIVLPLCRRRGLKWMNAPP